MEFPVRLNIADARMSLARVLQEDSKYQFTDHPSVLDMPWFSDDQLTRIDIKPRDLVLNENIQAEVDESGFMDYQDQPADKRTRWETCFQDMLVRDLFSRVFHVNETFEFHGFRLRDYFVSEDAGCKDWSKFRDTVVLNTLARIMWRRLFRTQHGLIGSITVHARPGDRIAIIYNCDMPVVLTQSERQQLRSHWWLFCGRFDERGGGGGNQERESCYRNSLPLLEDLLGYTTKRKSNSAPEVKELCAQQQGDGCEKALAARESDPFKPAQDTLIPSSGDGGRVPVHGSAYVHVLEQMRPNVGLQYVWTRSSHGRAKQGSRLSSCCSSHPDGVRQLICNLSIIMSWYRCYLVGPLVT